MTRTMVRSVLVIVAAAAALRAPAQTPSKHCVAPKSGATPVCPTEPGRGWTQQLPLQFDINWPYDTLNKCAAPPPEGKECTRYSGDDAGVYTLWVYGNDKPFQKGSLTKPRSEHRYLPNYTSGQIYYAADFQVAPESDNVCILQIHTGSPQDKNPEYGETVFMAFWSRKDGGSVSCYTNVDPSRELASDLGENWFHIALTHDLATGVITVCVNGQKPHAIQDNGAKNFFLKDGVYAQTNHSDKMKVRIKNIEIWTHAP